jgi:hypothetical protein
MNWKTGFIRAWIVVTAIWDIWLGLYLPTHIYDEPPDSVGFPNTYHVAKAAVLLVFWNYDDRQGPMFYGNEFFGLLAYDFLMVPLAVLLIGFGIAWTIKGLGSRT